MSFISGQKLHPADVMNNEYLQWTITTPLYNIGEQVYQLSDSYKSQHPSIPPLPKGCMY